MRAPCVIRWPGHIKPGTVYKEMFASLDWLPTFVDIAGGPSGDGLKTKIEAGQYPGIVKTTLDGVNQRDYLEGKTKSARDMFFCYTGATPSAVRYKNFSMAGACANCGLKGVENYKWAQVDNIKRDPFETAIGFEQETVSGVRRNETCQDGKPQRRVDRGQPASAWGHPKTIFSGRFGCREMPAWDSNLELGGYMKPFSFKLFAALFFFGAVSVLGINAQLPPNGVEFKAPFAFVIGTSNLPAGDYTIRPSQEDPDVLDVTGPSGHSVFAYCDEVDLNSPSAKSEITFRKYGSGTTRFLKQIAVGGSCCTFASGTTEKTAKKSGSPSKDVVEGKAK